MAKPALHTLVWSMQVVIASSREAPEQRISCQLSRNHFRRHNVKGSIIRTCSVWTQRTIRAAEQHQRLSCYCQEVNEGRIFELLGYHTLIPRTAGMFCYPP